MRRIYRNVIWIGIAGALAALAWKGWAAGAGFLAGAAASGLNFRWLHRLVDSLGAVAPAPRKARIAWLFGLRYLIFGTAAYVIVKFFGVNLVAVLAGLLAAVAAVMVEILYELVYARA